MSKLTPYFLFDGNCAEAMNFYKSCLGGELTVVTVGESPMKAQMPQEFHHKVINARLVSGGIDVSASDWLLPNRTPKKGNTTCAYISGATYEELSRYFHKLSAGASAEDRAPLKEMPFGTYGALTDKYGVRWMFQGDAQK